MPAHWELEPVPGGRDLRAPRRLGCPRGAEGLGDLQPGRELAELGTLAMRTSTLAGQ